MYLATCHTTNYYKLHTEAETLASYFFSCSSHIFKRSSEIKLIRKRGLWDHRSAFLNLVESFFVVLPKNLIMAMFSTAIVMKEV